MPGTKSSRIVGQQLVDALAGAQQLSELEAIRNKAQRQAGKKSPEEISLAFRQTLIPVFLTVGSILLLASAFLLLGGEDNAMVDLFPRWTPVVLLVAAFASYAAGAANMISVKAALSHQPEFTNKAMAKKP